jgi:predicted protein tyrosine phosphatase
MLLVIPGWDFGETQPLLWFSPVADRLILNLVDVSDPSYIPDEIMDAAVAFIHEHLKAGQRVLVHCNQGQSRAPAIAMLYLGSYTERLSRSSFEQALTAFQEIYPPFSPAAGVLGFLSRRWTLWPTLGIG